MDVNSCCPICPKFLVGDWWASGRTRRSAFISHFLVCFFFSVLEKVSSKFAVDHVRWVYAFGGFSEIPHSSSSRLKQLSTSFRTSSRRTMARSVANNPAKKYIRIYISSDNLCPWCFVGKKNLDKAVASTQDQYDFEIFKGLGMEYDLSGLTGNALDSHRLLYLAGTQGLDKQHSLAEELFLGYFTQGKYIGYREFLIESARKVRVEGATEFLEDPSNGLKEDQPRVNEVLQQYSAQISGVPHYVINGKYQLSGGQSTESFLKAFQMAASSDA